MKDGNYSARLDEQLDKLIEMRKIYTNLRGENLDLFTVGGRLIALPDAERETHKDSRDYLVMNEKDWEIYSIKLKKTVVAETFAKRDYFEKMKPDEETRKRGIESAKSTLESKTEAGRPMKEFPSSRSYIYFGLQALKEAAEGGLPVVES